MEEKVNETTVQVDAELNKKKKVWESDIHGAIFDVDGTLLDSMVIWEEAANLFVFGKKTKTIFQCLAYTPPMRLALTEFVNTLTPTILIS